MVEINNKKADITIEDILSKLQSQLTNGKLSRFRRTSSGIKVQCPVHSDGREEHESCYIADDGVWHCFTCGEKGYIDKFIAKCFDEDDSFGKRWLLNNFDFKGDSNTTIKLEPLEFNVVNKQKYLNESILDKFQSFHPYMIKRKLSQDICERFKVKYDKDSNCLVFPVWDENNKLVMLTKRNVENKNFFIDKDVEKPVYLYNYIKNNNIISVIVCESQINCLYAWTLGYPAIALFGTGTQHQYDILNKSGIRHYILAFDGDNAGDKGTERFINNIRKDVFVDVLKLPRTKDLNDLSSDEFNKLMKGLN